MSVSVDPTLRHLNDCACCEGISAETPVEVSNRPGLSAIVYRVGTHAQFKDTLRARLSGSEQLALRDLSTRADDDFSLAVLDAWATVADVLTFYQERIANESYLRTATERLSVLELARLIDYQLRPGVAASTILAFTIEDAPGAFGQALSTGTTAQSAPVPPPITIGIGTKVQSIPGPGEQAQTFETIEKIEARAEWNALKPRLLQPQVLSVDMGSIILQGTATNLKRGDTVLIVDLGGRKPRTILNVTVNDEAKTTRIDFDSPALSPPKYDKPFSLKKGSIHNFLTKEELSEGVIQRTVDKTRWSEEDLSALAKMQNWSVEALVANVTKQTARHILAANTGVFALRQHAAIFGHNAPIYTSLLKPGGLPLYPNDWDKNGWEIWKDSMENTYYGDADVYLERSLPGVIRDTWVVFEQPTAMGPSYTVYRISAVNEASLAGFGMSGKSTGLKLTKVSGSGLANNTTDKPPDFKVRKTTVHLQSEQLELADVPIEDLVQGNSVTLNRMHLGLKVGQKIILTGEREDLRGEVTSETMTLKNVIIEAGFTVLSFRKSLAYRYVRATVSINANVALSTHGESVQEVLGSGDASQAFQRFALRQPPLTYVSASTPSGAQTTLEVRVNDLLWHEVPTLYDHGPEERIYVTRTDDAGNTTVRFGDGKTGARLPTGQENVKARYRKGIGLPGLLKANQLTQLMTRPLGVKGVTNLLAPNGAENPEKLDEARRNAPLTVLTLGRVVSLQDYEDFARSFSGISKALATWVWSGERRTVFVTVAGANGAEVKADSELYANLVKALRQFGDPGVSLRLASYQPRLFRLSAAIKVDADFLSDKVLAAVEQKLRASFSFEARTFGQPVHLSEIIAVMQNVPGVVAVDVNELYRTDQPAGLSPRLEAAAPRLDGDTVLAAELLTLDPRPLGLEVLP